VKNKKLTYVLLPGAMLIWVIVIYQIIAAVDTSDSGESSFNPPKNVSTEKYSRDTFKLKADYRDPFLGSVARKPVAQKKSNNKPKKQKKKPEKIQWPEISFQGLIRNEKSGEEVAVVRIDGMEYLIRKGDVLFEITVNSFSDSDVVLTFNNEMKTFKKQ